MQKDPISFPLPNFGLVESLSTGCSTGVISRGTPQLMQNAESGEFALSHLEQTFMFVTPHFFESS
jgi:hypothetical protein